MSTSYRIPSYQDFGSSPPQDQQTAGHYLRESSATEPDSLPPRQYINDRNRYQCRTRDRSDLATYSRIFLIFMLALAVLACCVVLFTRCSQSNCK